VSDGWHEWFVPQLRWDARGVGQGGCGLGWEFPRTSPERWPRVGGSTGPSTGWCLWFDGVTWAKECGGSIDGLHVAQVGRQAVFFVNSVT
jgi:hypothetical protein